MRGSTPVMPDGSRFSRMRGSNRWLVSDGSVVGAKNLSELVDRRRRKEDRFKVNITFIICMMASNSKGVKRRIREFKVSWLDDNCFKGWLTPHPSENRALCMACNTTISCRKTDLIRHSQTVKHIDKVKSLNFEAIDNNNNNNKSHNSKVKSAEIKLATFFAEHIPLIKDIFNDSEIAQDISLARTKCSHIIKNIIAKRETEKIVDNLKTRYFSILVDESTDISDHKVMCTLARFLL